jgi:hypothetical protein
MTDITYFASQFKKLKQTEYSQSPQTVKLETQTYTFDTMMNTCMQLSHLFLNHAHHETVPVIKFLNLTLSKTLHACVFENNQKRDSYYTLFVNTCHKVIEIPTTSEVQFLYYNELVKQRKNMIELILERIKSF